ncbi:hypothetical protein V6N13_025519 [Hibiscus sabdariffa]|uniref:Uncharacterized protein n=1 Tax=Hibiscus sabdariffa TaxID=183260 RepID=A0ABR2P8U4_9ROSI
MRCMAAAPVSRWLRDEGDGVVPTTTTQQVQSHYSMGRSRVHSMLLIQNSNMGGNLGVVVNNVGCSSSKSKLDLQPNIVDPVISNQIIQGNNSGFDIVMAHKGEKTLEPIPDGPK